MAVSLSCREKVVNSVFSLTFLLSASFPVAAQPTYSSVSVYPSHHSQSLKEVIADLEKKSGFHVIYSSDKINLSQRIAVSAQRLTVAELVAALERQAGISVMVRDRHFVIRGSTRAAEKAEMQTPKVVAESRAVSLSALSPKSPAPNEERYIVSARPLMQGGHYLNAALRSVDYVFDSAVLKQLPPSDLSGLNTRTRHRGWFLSTGIFVNDYSAGLEVQGGLRSLFAVYNVGRMRDGAFHLSYGLGSSVLLSHNFSLNPTYLYGELKEAGSVTAMSMPATRYGYEATTRHHQFKLMLQYAISEKVRMSFGPTFNKSNTRYEYSEAPFGGFFVASTKATTATRTEAGTQFSGGSVNYYIQESPRPVPTQSIKLWVGWEASVYYRVNFFKRK